VILRDLVLRAAERTPEAPAVVAPDATLTYGELDALSHRVVRALRALGVEPGDRVGLWTEKSARAIAWMQGATRMGAVYVPIDPLTPAARAGLILRDCGVKVVLTTAERAKALGEEAAPRVVRVVRVDDGPEAWGMVLGQEASPLALPEVAEDALAYILYTSGSTGVPKGVCISHRNALAFVGWAVEAAAVRPDDRLSNHASFAFDLSVFDLYAAFWAGAAVVLVPEFLSYLPERLVGFIARQRISIWYSVPSALMLLIDRSDLLQREDLALRTVIFAGEPFPVKHLRRLRQGLSSCRMFNWYGPTETNVCTSYEVRALEPERVEPVPIGQVCSGDRAFLDPGPEGAGGAADPELGELCVEGPTVMLGYWGKPPQGQAPYRTGDLCRRLPSGDLVYLGRRDNMVKVRGRRIELGDIEAALLSHPALAEAAVLVQGEELDARLVAFVVARERAPALAELRQHCGPLLPSYMLVDEALLLESLPRTPNGKIDRAALRARLPAL
jgi:amino acid adenylation domain-containing protein